MTDHQLRFAKNVLQVMRAQGVSVEQLEKKAPYGFWPKVAELMGQKTTAANMYWHKHRAGLLAHIREAGEPVDNTVIVDNVAEVEEPTTTDKVDTLDTAPKVDTDDKVDQITRDEVVHMIEAVETRLTKLIDDKLVKVVKEEGAVAFEEHDRPPKPPKTGKKFTGDKEDLRARIDKALFERLERDCKAHFGGNMSATLDAVLWQYYGKPALSFEDQDDTEA